MIKVTNLAKIYKDKSSEQEVFSELSFSFNKSGSYSVVGPSGSGKTTFLNLLSGLDSFNSGSININGMELHKATAETKSNLRKKLFGFAYQFHYLLENLTVFENCLACCFGKDDGSIDEILKNLKINHIKDKFPSNISGGEKQRASIARALARKPKILILDEPTGNLDQLNSSIIQDFILNYACENKSLVIYATHDISFAERADKMLEISNKGLV